MTTEPKPTTPLLAAVFKWTGIFLIIAGAVMVCDAGLHHGSPLNGVLVILASVLWFGLMQFICIAGRAADDISLIAKLVEAQFIHNTVPAKSAESAHDTAGWFYMEADKVCGPKSRTDLRKLYAKGEITATTPMCREGSQHWTDAAGILG
jgi:hypothetical protein